MHNMENVTETSFKLHTESSKILEYFILGLIIFTAYSGILGNGILAAIQSRLKNKSSTDFFVLTQAVLDLGCCAIASPVLVAETVWPTLALSIAYGLKTSIVFTGSFTTVFLLSTIAVDRYMRTCRPTELWYTRSKAKRLCITCGIASLILVVSLYLLSMYGENKLLHVCDISPLRSLTTYITDIIVGTAIVVMILITSVCYYKITVRLRRRIHQKMERRKNLLNKLRGFKRRKKIIPEVMTTKQTVKIIDEMETDFHLPFEEELCADQPEHQRRLSVIDENSATKFNSDSGLNSNQRQFAVNSKNESRTDLKSTDPSSTLFKKPPCDTGVSSTVCENGSNPGQLHGDELYPDKCKDCEAQEQELKHILSVDCSTEVQELKHIFYVDCPQEAEPKSEAPASSRSLDKSPKDKRRPGLVRFFSEMNLVMPHSIFSFDEQRVSSMQKMDDGKVLESPSGSHTPTTGTIRESVFSQDNDIILRNLQQRTRRMNNVSFMMSVVILLFTVFWIIRSISAILCVYTSPAALPFARLTTLTIIISYAYKPFVYMVLSSAVRKNAWKLVFGRCHHS